MAFSAEDVERIVTAAVKQALQALLKQTATASAHTIMDHIDSRIPKFTFKPEENHTFERWYERYSPIIEAGGGSLQKADKIRFIISKLNANEYDVFVNFIKPTAISDLTPEDAIAQLTKVFSVTTSLFKRRMRSLNIKRSGRPLKELMGVINEAAEAAEWGGMTLDQMKQYILMLSLMSSEDNVVRARAARLMEEDDEYSFPKIMEDLDRFEQLRKDLAPAPKTRSNIKKVEWNWPRQTLTPSTSSQVVLCYRCLKTNHRQNECRFKSATCSFCSKVGHIAKACSSKQRAKPIPERRTRPI